MFCSFFCMTRFNDSKPFWKRGPKFSWGPKLGALTVPAVSPWASTQKTFVLRSYVLGLTTLKLGHSSFDHSVDLREIYRGASPNGSMLQTQYSGNTSTTHGYGIPLRPTELLGFKVNRSLRPRGAGITLPVFSQFSAVPPFFFRSETDHP
jgi:hypothetical protein